MKREDLHPEKLRHRALFLCFLLLLRDLEPTGYTAAGGGLTKRGPGFRRHSAARADPRPDASMDRTGMRRRRRASRRDARHPAGCLLISVDPKGADD